MFVDAWTMVRAAALALAMAAGSLIGGMVLAPPALADGSVPTTLPPATYPTTYSVEQWITPGGVAVRADPAGDEHDPLGWPRRHLAAPASVRVSGPTPLLVFQ